jgi:hypothetical protein
MSAIIKEKNSDFITVEVKISLNRDMIESENNILDAVNDVGTVATEELLKSFDSDGSPITVAGIKMTSKGLESKKYHTPYGDVDINRHVYQTSKGGKIYCPLEDGARIILASTPKFSSQISRKMAEMPASCVVMDLKENHNRSVVKNFVQRLSDLVASVVQAKEEVWEYELPEQKGEIATLSFGVDGANILMTEGGYRQAMAGTISAYDAEGNRQFTTYIAASPESGKETFKKRMDNSIKRAKELHPKALCIGIADGAADNWDFLEQYTDKQTLDFFHATEYLADVADSLFFSDEIRKKWLENRCHQLKHFKGAATDILGEVVKLYEHVVSKTSPKILNFRTEIIDDNNKSTIKNEEIEVSNIFNRNINTKPIDAFISYFKNNISKNRMTYAENLAIHLPIGSGVTESACKMIIKSRLSQSGMRWKEKGAGVILTLRAIARSSGMWEQFWKKS